MARAARPGRAAVAGEAAAGRAAHLFAVIAAPLLAGGILLLWQCSKMYRDIWGGSRQAGCRFVPASTCKAGARATFQTLLRRQIEGGWDGC